MSWKSLLGLVVALMVLGGCVGSTASPPTATIELPREIVPFGTLEALPTQSVAPPPPSTLASTATRSAESVIADAVPITKATRLQFVASWQAGYSMPVWSPDSSMLAFEVHEGADESVGLVRLSEPNHVAKFPIPTEAWSLAFDPGGLRLAVVHKFGWPLRFLTIASGQFTEAADQAARAEGIWASYTPQGDYLYMIDAWGSKDYGDNSRLAVCHIAASISCRGFKSMRGFSGHFVILEGGSIIAAAVVLDAENFIYLWRADTGQQICAVHGGAPATNRQGTVLAAWDASEVAGQIRLWDPASCRPERSIEDLGSPIAIDSTSRFLVAYDEQGIRVLDLESSAVVSDLKPSVSLEFVSPVAIALSPDWRFIAFYGVAPSDFAPTYVVSLFAGVQ